ncbi:Phosphotransferase system, phosphocarrier protein HPr [Halanaerobium praevalens DSM 2228]|uniref:Phosphocarrier protein HPr n=1 Tax=Halanaerobium praevalens (strain ATCC 33744 / DSM 2228 / GSL) TaxID=572479 RepID=E3DQG1_HALPG|nr:HPr family phosphocarrier protein [Halanaerobium praevalens]ADO76857.1 Phosphotransferase system, phosphocarrier protein HPr [Halanaerobium praevalens DSM 2228]
MVKEKKVIITNKTGLHARPAAQFVQKAGKYDSKIEILFEEKEVNAKSIMGVMSLGVGRDDEIIVRAEGEDAEAAVKELVDFIEIEMTKEDE